MIEISGLNKRYLTRDGVDIDALKDVNLSVADGEFVTVVGPSGCGKSTLLKILAGTLRRSSGSVKARDIPLDGPSRDVGVVLQAPVLLPWRTVLENVMVPIEIQRLDRKVYEPRARALLKLVGLEGFEGKYPSELSGGMQQRVGISRGLVHDPAFVLMDEPFGALDAMTRETMNLELLRIWKESGKTVVLVTHSIPEAVFLADRVVVMSPRPGRITEILPIDLPRPRRLEMINSERFGGYVSAIRRHFHSLGALDA
ncbi:NitT/TauT family transport system ATP-binding protein [Variovorax sp. PDC80]|uniref:ABC transporter ATP-binding protein n=1 Tax=Variovorax sp. PDC80 TaxID=1882827 RepID=UPI0008F1770F|nr:ABC transporter ATP-binding protein [Variovorax sp. PDC80]SFQ03503.1 NitT/TauT family transport system ATP-binding protein [Variovorax sp. PDC80]